MATKVNPDESTHLGSNTPSVTTRCRRRRGERKGTIRSAEQAVRSNSPTKTEPSSWRNKIIAGVLAGLVLIPTIAIFVAPYFSSTQSAEDTCEDGHCEEAHRKPSRTFAPVMVHPIAYRSPAQHALIEYYCHPKEACLEITHQNAREYMAALDTTEFGLCIEDKDCVVPPETLREKCQEVLDEDAEVYRIMPVKHEGPTCQPNSSIQHSSVPFDDATQPVPVSLSAYTHHAHTAPQHRTGLTRFPQYLDCAIHPGLMSLDGCVVQPSKNK